MAKANNSVFEPCCVSEKAAIHTAKILRLSEDPLLVIEIVDGEENIHAFPPTLDAMMGSGLVTLEKMKVLRYGNGPSA